MPITHFSLTYILVRREGLEPPTHALEGHCSIQLSYRRIVLFYARSKLKSNKSRRFFIDYADK
jgi:hypothetical protein